MEVRHLAVSFFNLGTIMEKNKGLSTPKLAMVLVLFATLPMGLIGAFFGYANKELGILSGFLWGIGIAVTLAVGGGLGMLCWEWIKKEANRGKMLPYLLVGFVLAIAISSYLALSLGNPTCIESTDTDNRGSTCIEYADDGYEATTEQRWDKFWSTLPVTVIITSLVAVIVHSGVHKEQKQSRGDR